MVKDLLENEAARSIVERHLPGASSHPMLSEVMYLTLGEVASYPEAGISRQELQAILDELAMVDTGS